VALPCGFQALAEISIAVGVVAKARSVQLSGLAIHDQGYIPIPGQINTREQSARLDLGQFCC
jgi:hypothetical protein